MRIQLIGVMVIVFVSASIIGCVTGRGGKRETVRNSCASSRDRTIAATAGDSCEADLIGNPYQITLEHLIHSRYEMPQFGISPSGQIVPLGAFSGGQLLEVFADRIRILTHTDRGPNPDPIENRRSFLCPACIPEWVILDVYPATNDYVIVKRMPIRQKNGQPFDGIPPIGSNQEIPLDSFGTELTRSSQGIDPESLAKDPRGGYWMGDEYGPSLIYFNKNGREVYRLSPGAGLPEIYANRLLNRGFEGIAISGQILYAYLQSPIPDEELRGRILAVNVYTRQVTEYFYDFASAETAKIGDVAPLPNGQFLVIERNDEVGAAAKKFIYRVTMGEPGQPVKKELILDLAAAGFNAEKAEGLIVIDCNHFLILNDNDFQVNGQVDFKTGIYPTKPEKSQIYAFVSQKPFC